MSLRTHDLLPASYNTNAAQIYSKCLANTRLLARLRVMRNIQRTARSRSTLTMKTQILFHFDNVWQHTATRTR